MKLRGWAIAFLLVPLLAMAQAYPSKPIRMIVPFPAGGGTDFIARLAAKDLSDRLGQQVFVENRAGANGAIGLQALMQSDPDGYTIAASSDTPLVVNPWLYDKLPYQPLRDFQPDILARRGSELLIVEVKSRRSSDLGRLNALASAVERVPNAKLEINPKEDIAAGCRHRSDVVIGITQDLADLSWVRGI